MEVERTNNTRGLAGTALGLGAGALGVQLLNGGLGNILGGWGNGWNNGCGNGYGWSNGCGNGYGNGFTMPIINTSDGDRLINRYEAGQSARIAELETEVKLRDANTYTDQKMLEMYQHFDHKIGHIEHELCNQKAFNAGIMGRVGCIGDQVDELMRMTRRVVPNRSVCPGWGDVTVSITPTTAAAGAADADPAA